MATNQSQFLEFMRKQYEENTKNLAEKELDLHRRVELLETRRRSTLAGETVVAGSVSFDDTVNYPQRKSIESGSVSIDQHPTSSSPSPKPDKYHRLSFNYSRINLFNPELGWPVLPAARKLRSISFNILNNPPQQQQQQQQSITLQPPLPSMVQQVKYNEPHSSSSNKNNDDKDERFVLPPPKAKRHGSYDDASTSTNEPDRVESDDQSPLFVPFWQQQRKSDKRPQQIDEIPVKDDKLPTAGCGCNLNRIQPPFITNVASLTAADVDNLEKLNALAIREKVLHNSIQRLQEKERNLTDKIDSSKQCECSSNKNDDQLIQQNEELKIENELLLTELKEMRLEIRQYIEKMEPPSSLQLKNEIIKSQQLEQQNTNLSKNILELKRNNQFEIDSVKMQISVAYGNALEQKETNDFLKDEIKRLSERLGELQKEYIQLKIDEAKSIMAIQQEVQLQKIAQAEGDEADEENEEEIIIEEVQGEDGKPMKRRRKKKKKRKAGKYVCDKDLGVVARKLSAAIKEFIPCEECTTMLPDLGVAAKQIKDLSDLVNTTFRKAPPSEGATETETELPDDGDEEEIDEAEQFDETKTQDEQQEDPDKYKKDIIRKLREEACTCVQSLKLLDDAISGKGKGICTCMGRVDLKALPETPLEPFDPCECIKRLKSQRPSRGGFGTGYPCECWKKTQTTDTTCRCKEQRPSKPETKKPAYPCKCQDKHKGFGISLRKDGKDIPFLTDEKTEIYRKVEADEGAANIKSQTIVMNPKNVPVKVDTDVELIDKDPGGAIQVTTTLTKTGSIQVVTEGPEGLVETRMVYNKKGELEIHTDIVDPAGMKIRQMSGIEGHPPNCVCTHCKQLALEVKQGRETDSKADDKEEKEEEEIPTAAEGEASHPLPVEDTPLDPEVEKEIETIVIGEQ